MKLKNASRYFDTCPVYDGYTGDLLFKVQASTFMEAAAEGSVSVRRTISLDPELALPEHSVITVLGERYITGEVNFDEWNGEAIRKTCWTRKVSDSFAIYSAGDLLAYQLGVNLFGQKRQVSEVNTLDSSNLENVWEASFSAEAEIVKGAIAYASGKYYRVRNAYKDIDGFLTCRLDQLVYWPTSAMVGDVKVYNPVTDSYTGNNRLARCLPIDYKLVFDGQTQADFSVQQGDICLFLPLGVQAKTGMTVTLEEASIAGTWTVLNLVKESDYWNAHVRRL